MPGAAPCFDDGIRTRDFNIISVALIPAELHHFSLTVFFLSRALSFITASYLWTIPRHKAPVLCSLPGKRELNPRFSFYYTTIDTIRGMSLSLWPSKS